MDPLRIAVVVVAVPAAITVAVALLFRRSALGSSLAVSLGSIAGAIGVFGVPEPWPVDVTDRSAHLIAAGLVAALAGVKTRQRAVLSAAAGLAVAVAVIAPLSHRFPGLEMAAALAVGLLLLAALSASFSILGSFGDRSGLLIGALATAVASVATGLSGSVTIAQLGGAAAASIGVSFLLSLRRDSKELSRAAPVIAVALWATLAMAVLYAAMTPQTAALVAGAPIAAAAIGLMARRRFAAIALVALLGSAAIWSSLQPGGQTGVGDDSGYGYDSE